MDVDKNKIKGILFLLDLNELNSLVATTTQQLIKTIHSNKEDAIEVIIQHSSDAKSILKRRVITKEILFQYASDNKLSVFPPITKDGLIDTILMYWGSQNPNSRGHSQISTNNVQETQIEHQSEQFTRNSLEEMAVQFSNWFYSMFNDPNPIGEEHFWRDASLKVHLISKDSETDNEVHESASDVIKLLYEIKLTHRIYLNPNLSQEGVQGRISPHGLVTILVCGTIHSDDICVGVFEQVFSLARDPSVSNNWKIKNSQVNLRNHVTKTPPRLQDNPLTANLLALRDH